MTEKEVKMTENDCENCSCEGMCGGKKGSNSDKTHLEFTAQMVIAPTFDTETGAKLDNTEFINYKCTACDWNTQVYSAGQAGNQLILHALGLDDLKVDYLDLKDLSTTLDFDSDNPEEVLKAIARVKEKEGSTDE